MRKWFVLAGALTLTSCIPASEPPRRSSPQPSRIAPPVLTSAATRQCMAELGRQGIGFKALPDRYFAGGCSALGAVQLLEIGTPVSNLGAMTCPLARTFAGWAREAVQPAAKSLLGTQVVRIESMGTYACRSRNSQAGAPLSEHGLANAVDIAAFVLADGRRITVREGWRSGDAAIEQFLRAVHQAGCRRFQTGLGPEANALHHDHFHFDMGVGPYCR